MLTLSGRSLRLAWTALETSIPSRDHILDAALHVVRTRGAARATTRRIAAAAGCAEGSLYNHFADKEELLACVLAERLPSLLPLLAELPRRAADASLAANVGELLRGALAFFRELVPLIGCSLGDPGLRARHRGMLGRGGGGPQRVIEGVTGYLEREIELGRVRADLDPVAAATALIGACFHYAAFELVLPDELMPLDEEAFVRGTTALLVQGLARPGVRA